MLWTRSRYLSSCLDPLESVAEEVPVVSLADPKQFFAPLGFCPLVSFVSVLVLSSHLQVSVF